MIDFVPERVVLVDEVGEELVAELAPALHPLDVLQRLGHNLGLGRLLDFNQSGDGLRQFLKLVIQAFATGALGSVVIGALLGLAEEARSTVDVLSRDIR